MTLEQALQLARQIDAAPECMLLAVGRFVSPDEITDQHPWGCSLRRAGQTKSLVVWSPLEFAQCRAADTAEDTAAASQSEIQLSLF